MAVTNFSTRNDTWRRIMANGLTYRVPRFQRDYSWGPEEWDDLWQDILGTLGPEGEPGHYMGYLVLRTDDEERFEVIDGQQRLTTLSILVLAGLRLLQDLIEAGRDAEATQRRLESLLHAYIGHLDPVTLVSRPRLTLNRNNDSYYRNYLVPLAKPLPRRGFKASEHRLRKAFEWFQEKIQQYVKRQEDEGQAVAQLIEALSGKLFFTVISVTDQLNAYRVFETLNARGVRLSSTDLLKNYLFSLLDRPGQHEHELLALEERWEQIVGRLGAESLPDFLRVHWISRRAFVRKSDLFKTIRREITGPEEAFSLLRHMEEDVDVYLTLTRPDSEAPGSEEQRRSAGELRLFGVRQPLALLLAARRRFSETDFTALLRAIVVLSFRYNVIGNRHTGDQERAYTEAARRIERGEHTRIREVLEGLRPIYPSDEPFRAMFAEKSIGVGGQRRNHRIVRYILATLERHVHGDAVDADAPGVSMEHVCPTHPEEGWEDFTDAEVAALSSRLGNMLLLETPLNRKIGNAPYEIKRDAYRDSSFASANRLAKDFEVWIPHQVEARQREMAKAATAIWRISQLD